MVEPVYWFVDLQAPLQASRLRPAGGMAPSSVRTLAMQCCTLERRLRPHIDLGTHVAGVHHPADRGRPDAQRVSLRGLRHHQRAGKQACGSEFRLRSVLLALAVLVLVPLPAPAASQTTRRQPQGLPALAHAPVMALPAPPPPPQSGIDLQPGQQVAVAAGGAPGRFLVVYTGALSEGRMNLSDVQVYTFGALSYLIFWPCGACCCRLITRCSTQASRIPPLPETNAAAFKPLTLFGGSTLSTDGNVAGTPGSGQVWAHVLRLRTAAAKHCRPVPLPLPLPLPPP